MGRAHFTAGIVTTSASRGLHAVLGDQDAEVGALEAVVAGSVLAEEEAFAAWYRLAPCENDHRLYGGCCQFASVTWASFGGGNSCMSIARD